MSLIGARSGKKTDRAQMQVKQVDNLFSKLSQLFSRLSFVLPIAVFQEVGNCLNQPTCL